MALHKILYSDDSGVEITDSTLHVRKKTFDLKSIRKYRLSTKSRDRIAEIILFVIGIPVAICGLLNIISPADIPHIKIKDIYYNPNDVAAWAGIVYVAIALVPMLINRKNYVLRITTVEGKKNVLVSHNKEYIMKIIEVMNDAYETIEKRNIMRKPRKYTLSSRSQGA